MFEKLFKLKEHNTNVRTEILAGITTFMTMAYILIVNPNMLKLTGMDAGAVFTATALSAVVGTLVMALAANLPFALAPGMGLNAFFTYTVVFQMGYTWQFALTAVLLEGIIFILLTFLNVREAIINAIPMSLKHAISVGIGLFISLIGFINAGIVQSGKFIVGENMDSAFLDGLVIQLGDITSPSALVALVGIVVIGVLLAKKVKGALLIGILASTLIGIPLGVTDLSLVEFNGFMPPSLAPIFMQFEFQNILTIDMFIVLMTFLFVDMFDTVGTLVGVSSKAGLLDAQGRVPNAKQALLADAIGTTFGACVGTSTVTTYVESASGVADGGRTGLTALSTAVMFFLALFLAPVFLVVPSAATAPALIIVGLFMMSPIKKIDFDDYTESLPAFLTMIMMPLSYSIADGIIFGVVSYVLIKVFAGKSKDVPILAYILAALFVAKFILL
jgi:AGZA family xanthine/uracil permease-like MFS transporter